MGTMMLIWNGKGYLVAVATFIAALGAEYLSESTFADQTYFQTHGWPLAAAFSVAGIFAWFAGSYLHGKGGRTFIDKATGKEITIGGDDALFFIPMRYWGPILVVAAVAVLIYRGV